VNLRYTRTATVILNQDKSQADAVSCESHSGRSEFEIWRESGSDGCQKEFWKGKQN